VCGSGVGTFLFAPLATWLIDLLGWRGANLIFAGKNMGICEFPQRQVFALGFCLNCAVFGALMRPLELTAREQDRAANKRAVNEGDDIFYEEEEEEEEEEDAPIDFVVQLPDGTQREHRMGSAKRRSSKSRLGHRGSQESGDGPLVPVAEEDAQLMLSGSVKPALPTIEESSITKLEDK